MRPNIHKGLMPYQDCPNQTPWKLWKRVLLSLTSDGTTLTRSLGRWLVTGEDTHRSWPNYYCTKTDTLYIREEVTFQRYKRNSDNEYVSKGSVQAIPAKTVPVDVDFSRQSPNCCLIQRLNPICASLLRRPSQPS